MSDANLGDGAIGRLSEAERADLLEALATAINDEWMRLEHDCDGTDQSCAERCPRPAYQRMGLDELRDAAVTAAAAIVRTHAERALAEERGRWIARLDATELNQAAIRARLEAATPGPWEWEPDSCSDDGLTYTPSRVWTNGGVDYFGEANDDYVLASHLGSADAEFIAHARTDVGLLLTALDEARTQVDRLHFDLDREARARQAAEQERDEARAEVERLDARRPACVCPTDDLCPRCHPRWHAAWAARIAAENAAVRADAFSEDAQAVLFGVTGTHPETYGGVTKDEALECAGEVLARIRAALATPTTTEEPS